MNWVAVKGTENDFSIHAQRLQSLSGLCISSLSNSLRNGYKLRSNSTIPRSEYVIEDIVDYFRSFPYFSNSTQSVLPYWISDLLYNHISKEEDCPEDFIEEFFSQQVCTLSNITLANLSSLTHISDRLSHLKSYHLTSLDFSENLNIFSSSFVPLFASNVSHSLRTLKLRGCTNFDSISSLFCFMNLAELELSENGYLNWGSHSLLEAMSEILSSFTHLQILDLHCTNLFPSCYANGINILHGFAAGFPDPLAFVKLQELYLFIHTSHYEPYLAFTFKSNICKFYEFLFQLLSITHLDLSGWPCLNELPKNALTDFSEKLTFFGLYHTSITDEKSDVLIHSVEVTGLCEEKYLVPTVARYYRVSGYLTELFARVHNNIKRKSVIYSDDTLLKLTPIVLDALDHCTSLLLSQAPPASWQNLKLVSACTACLYLLGNRIQRKLSDAPVRRFIESSITLLHYVGVNGLNKHSTAGVVLNACKICASFSIIYCFKQSNQTMHFALAKFILSIINKACQEPDLLYSPPKTDLSFILYDAQQILHNMLFDLERDHKTYVGIGLNGIDILMRFIDMRLTAKRIDEDLVCAWGIIMGMTYLCFPNCLRLCKQEHSAVLVRALCQISHSNLIGEIMGSIENIAEFCIQEESAAVSSQLLASVLTVLQNHAMYNQNAISSAIAVSAYFAMGSEKWGWEESGEEMLSLAVELIGQLDYRVARSNRYETLDFLEECLGAKEKRIMLCALWIICNLVYAEPEYYLNLLTEETIKMIRGILSSHPNDSIYHRLSREVVKLSEIITKCAEL